jgi:hypothetical protein
MAFLTERDLDLFLVMSLGVARLDMIGRFLKEVGYEITESALLKRLSILKKARYVTSYRYNEPTKHGTFAVYSLTQKSVRELAAMDHPIEFIRAGLPRNYFMQHEVAVTAVLHAMEIERIKGMYEFHFLDSSRLKQMADRRSRKNVPDLRVSFSYRDKTRAGPFLFEIDLGTVPMFKMVDRIRAALNEEDVSLLILCNRKSRIDSFISACSQSISPFYKTSEQVWFALLSEFRKGGMAETSFIGLDSRPRRLFCPECGLATSCRHTVG